MIGGGTLKGRWSRLTTRGIKFCCIAGAVKYPWLELGGYDAAPWILSGSEVEGSTEAPWVKNWPDAVRFPGLLSNGTALTEDGGIAEEAWFELCTEVVWTDPGRGVLTRDRLRFLPSCASSLGCLHLPRTSLGGGGGSTLSSLRTINRDFSLPFIPVQRLKARSRSDCCRRWR